MTMARASATRRPMPPESSAGINSAAPRKPTACNFVSTNCRISRSVRSVCSRSGKATFSNTAQVRQHRAVLEQHAHPSAQYI